MKNKLICTFCSILLGVLFINAQDRKLQKANKYYNDFQFTKAIVHYERLVSKGNTAPEIYQNLGDANYLNANYEEAAKWYGMLSELEGVTLDKNHTYRYAQSLRSLKDYTASDKLMTQLYESKQTDQRGINFKENSDYLNRIKERLNSYTIENLSINSEASDFAPSFRLEGIVFSTARDTSGLAKNIHTWNQKRFSDLYAAAVNEDGSLENITKFSKELNTKLHESSSVFTKDGQTVYFTRNNEKKRKFSRDKQGVSRLKIYKSVLKNGKWLKAVPLPFNNDDYSVAHPTLNKAEDKLYFSSDMPGSLGHSDIFVVDILSNGTYSDPVNLGKKINTESRESFPFVAENDVLYFASDGHPGLGGMDVFAVDLKNIENSYILNLGEPLNSVADDFSLVINSAKNGYFASNRADGTGSDDIYALTEVRPLALECFKNIGGIVKDHTSGELITDALIEVANEQGETIAEAITNENGVFEIKANCNEEISTLKGSKDNYESDTQSFTDNTDSNLVLHLKKTNLGAPVGTDLVTYLALEPIYFDFDKWHIREDAKVSLAKIKAYLHEYPDVKIQIGSHTDARATKAYNMRLSDKRANSTMEYLIDQGISKDRLRALGFGETMITNECVDHVACPAHKHQENRRSEFIVLEQ